MVSIKTKEDAISWLETVLDHTTDGDRRTKANALLKSGVSKPSDIDKVKDMVTQEFTVDVE